MNDDELLNAFGNGYLGVGNASDPFIFSRDKEGEEDINETFRRHLFEAILHASLAPKLLCLFMFIPNGKIYKVTLNTKPYLDEYTLNALIAEIQEFVTGPTEYMDMQAKAVRIVFGEEKGITPEAIQRAAAQC
jgi:hypothetical protein